jgi:hypothetical protein
MYRRFGDWKLLVREFAMSITQEVLQDVIHHSDARYAVESACVFADIAKDEIDPEKRSHHRDYFSLLTWWKISDGRDRYFLESLMKNERYGRPRSIRKRALALMYVCKRYGIPRDMRKLLCYILNNLEADYIVIHELVERRKYALAYTKHNAIVKYKGYFIRRAIQAGWCYYLPWVLRRCGLRWKWTRTREELICMNMEECFIPNKKVIFNISWLFQPSDYEIKDWTPTMLDIAKQKQEWKNRVKINA